MLDEWPRQTRSINTAVPCPTPTHIVANPNRPPVRASSKAAVPTIRAPVIPKGWPSAIAPPLGFTRASSSAIPSPRKTANPCAAKASFSSITDRSASPTPCCANNFCTAGTGP